MTNEPIDLAQLGWAPLEILEGAAHDFQDEAPEFFKPFHRALRLELIERQQANSGQDRRPVFFEMPSLKGTEALQAVRQLCAARASFEQLATEEQLPEESFMAAAFIDQMLNQAVGCPDESAGDRIAFDLNGISTQALLMLCEQRASRAPELHRTIETALLRGALRRMGIENNRPAEPVYWAPPSMTAEELGQAIKEIVQAQASWYHLLERHKEKESIQVYHPGGTFLASVSDLLVSRLSRLTETN